MRLTDQQIHERLSRIEIESDPSSEYFGRLVRWRDVVWHFGVGLSDRAIFNTGRGLDIIEHHWVAASVIEGESHFEPEHTVERLKHAVEVFGGWGYHLLRWNCEHFARLVVEGDPVCHQVRDLPKPVSEWHNRGHRPDAGREFRKRLESEAPHLYLPMKTEEPRIIEATEMPECADATC